jgi:hypothetical protein
MIACERLFGGASSAVLVFVMPRDTVLSLIFVPLTYFGPGMFKSFVTLRARETTGFMRWSTTLSRRTDSQ